MGTPRVLRAGDHDAAGAIARRAETEESGGPAASSRTSEAAATQRLDHAVWGLERRHTGLSAATAMPGWQRVALALAAALLIASIAFPSTGLSLAFAAVLAVPFTFVVILRVVAWLGLAQPAADAPAPSLAASALPRYSVLVPLFGEAAIVGQIVHALDKLDYPRDRLEILFVLESADKATIDAFAALTLPACMRTVVVPPGEPRTKPRALNYALLETSGDMIVVYDAEDEPEPDQLRRAAAAFRAGGPRLGCLQARLNIYNPHASWWARLFTIEYSVLFDAILPALERLGLPVLLGGTSNHFPREVLDEVGAWDAFNVTEDADLGLRLARFGWHVGVLDSTTYEEAPAEWRVWRGQRTRWLKGWMQTYLVHMRRPLALWNALGPRRFLGLQLLMGALLMAALVHPLFFLVAVPQLVARWLASAGLSPAEMTLWTIVGFNLVAGYIAAIALGLRAVALRHAGLGRSCLWIPLYWLAISLAAYRALLQLVRAPHLWEKTEHRGRNPLAISSPSNNDQTI